MAAGVLASGGIVTTNITNPAVASAQSDIYLGTTEMPTDITLFIHKRSKGELGGDRDTGLPKSDPGGEKLVATFSVQKITEIDLSTNDGWKKAEQLSKKFDSTNNQTAVQSITKAGYTLGSGSSIKTDRGYVHDHKTGTGETTEAGTGTGSAKFGRGLYLVTETETPTGYKGDVKPFIITLPITNPVNTTRWLNEVHVHPKNQREELGATKTVKDSDAIINGQNIQYTLDQPLVPGPTYDGIVLVDHYPADRLEFLTDPAPEVKIQYDDGSGTEEVVLEADKHYTVTNKAEEGKNEGKVVVKFTSAGLGQVYEILLDENINVSMKLNFKVKPNQPAETSPIENKYKTWTHRREEPAEDPTKPPVVDPPTEGTENPETPPTGTPPNPYPYPRSFYGNVDIIKKDASGAKLTGAEFDLFVCTDVNTLTTKLNKTAIVANDGVEIRGLLANDYRDDKVVPEANQTSYCLKETKAPEDHELLAEPIIFKVERDKTDPTIVPVLEKTIVNTKGNGGFNLPMTGGKGVFMLLLAGLGFLVLGRGYSARFNRRRP
ncbi:hypothetical protein CPHO_01910 [Corynebacterium phocae]|uniref:Uncharacterized protein n=2 Tax=Corynebacterium phocae TaxID=161895 RepID=A0A1L7D195_9CORY|nr:hypothetical protein CPHO_01910 [Corynebacterium phocae]